MCLRKVKLETVKTVVKLEYLKLDSILVKEGVRKTLGEEKSFEELTDSIAKHGVLQPILVEPAEEEGHYRLLIGERRFRAAVKAGLTTVPAMLFWYAIIGIGEGAITAPLVSAITHMQSALPSFQYLGGKQ